MNYWTRPAVTIGEIKPMEYNKRVFERVLSIMETFSGLDRELILSKSRKKERVLARICIIYYMVNNTSISLKMLGRWMHRDHSTMIHNRDNARDYIDINDKYFTRFYNEFKARL